VDAAFQVSAAGLYASCFALSIMSALLPWVNCELLLLSLAALASSPCKLACLVLLTSMGQMAGKCVLYWAGRGSIRFQSARVSRTTASWRQRLERSAARPLTFVFVSSALGIPPFYVTTILAGAVRLQFGRFVGVGLCGRLVRFGLIVFIPHLAIRLFRQ
jgi:membrane protein YqaA with SNARE-associated domain